MKLKPPNAAAKRGISQITALAYADVECAMPADFTRKQLGELDAGFEYLAQLTSTRHRRFT